MTDEHGADDHHCPECVGAVLETVAEIARIEACHTDAAADVEVLCIGNVRYVGLRVALTEDVAEACASIINSGGVVITGALFHASAARQLAGALLNAADMLEAPVELGDAEFEELLGTDDE